MSMIVNDGEAIELPLHLNISLLTLISRSSLFFLFNFQRLSLGLFLYSRLLPHDIAYRT